MSEQVGSWEIQAAAHLEEIDRLRKKNEALRKKISLMASYMQAEYFAAMQKIDRLRDAIREQDEAVDYHKSEAYRLRKENKALREDAERYRWGLEHPAMMANHFIKWRSNANHYNCRNTGKHPSEAIDAARRGDDTR